MMAPTQAFLVLSVVTVRTWAFAVVTDKIYANFYKNHNHQNTIATILNLLDVECLCDAASFHKVNVFT